MAVTGANIIDRVAKTARMNGTASSADRALILAWAQEAAERVCVDGEIRTPTEASVTLTGGTSVYQINASPFPTDMAYIHSLRIASASSAKPLLERKSWDEITELGAASAGSSSDPLYFGVAYPQVKIVPTPGTTMTATLSCVQTAPTLADSSSAISLLPDAYMWMTVYPLTMYNAMLHKHQPEANDWLAKYEQQGLPKLLLWKQQVGGDVSVDWLPDTSGFASFPDVYP